MSDIDVSYVIPCYNSGKTLPFCIAAILAQQGSFTKEIIIADSSPVPVSLPPEAGDNSAQVRLIHSKNRLFPGEARNFGLQAAQGKFLALIDSDVVLNPDWTRRMLTAHQRLTEKHGPYILLGGSMENHPHTADIWSDALTLIEFYRVLPTDHEEQRWELPAANLFLTAQTLRDLGLIFPAQRMAEDILFCKEALRKGAVIYFLGANKVHHMIMKKFFRYTFYMGAATCIVRFGTSSLPIKLLFILSMPFGSLYKFTTILLGLIRNEPQHLGFLVRRLPSLCLGLLSLHAGMLAYPFTKSRWTN